MKTWNRTQIVGVVIPLAVKRYGKSLANGCGTFAWNWAINCILIRCAQPSLLLPSRLPRRTRLPPRAMLPPRWVCPGNKAASRVKTFPSSRMARSVAPPASRLWRTSDAESRWEPAHGLCGQHPQLPPLPAAGAVSMAGQRHRQAAPGERAAASTRRRV